MKLLGPTRHVRLNEAGALVLLAAGLLFILSLASYHAQDVSFNTATAAVRPLNLIGRFGAHLADMSLQMLGLGAFGFPFLLFVLAWKWLRSEPVESQGIKVFGGILFVLGLCTAFALGPGWRPFGGAITAGGLAGILVADSLVSMFNTTGAVVVTAVALVLSLYLISKFSMAMLAWLLAPMVQFFRTRAEAWSAWRERRRHEKRERALERAALKEEQKREKELRKQQQEAARQPQATAEVVPAEQIAQERRRRRGIPDPDPEATARMPQPPAQPEPQPEAVEDDAPPFEPDIPIHALEEYAPTALSPAPAPEPEPAPAPAPAARASEPEPPRKKSRQFFQLPGTELLKEPSGRPPYDSQELKDIAARMKAKFEEFNVLGSVVQINPGPVVTTFEFKPEAGVKYSRITALSEDLCLGLQTESVLIERIPGKPTVGIEVPNSKREVISFRQIMESDEFHNSASPLTFSLGKDISGRIKIASMESMPHLLIAGSTGSGKSVMLNTMIMSVLFKSTPHDVRMIMVDPKRVELGIYEGIPHLLTPVITDPRKATNALKNAVLEMERRLKLLASQGVRNIDQYNKKVRKLKEVVPRSLFDEDEPQEELETLPYILIIIDELADLMMLERAGVEESVTRLAQMARAVGMHIVLATQRPSVDVITGLIKANFPARLSFRVATRVDSRTILDVMGAEHLLGKGDMLFLPPGSSRLTRVHGAYVTEGEIDQVVEFWKAQAQPEYDQTFLIAPPSDDGDEPEEFDGEEDPMYQDAVRVVLEMGKASTSTLQRRLRLGYGRAARILDMMQREGIIGPPDGSRPRDVLKRPDWLSEVESSLR
jgi:DNA segregation ATPase FtsK/SpoIIIE, S-DNA-T family